jgi:hypothetical protein
VVISPEQHERYQSGGDAAKRVSSEVVSEVYFLMQKYNLKGFTHEEQQAVQIARRLYMPDWQKFKDNEVWTRSILRFSWAFEDNLDSNEKLQELMERILKFRSVFRTQNEFDYNIKFLELSSLNLFYYVVCYILLSIIIAPFYVTLRGYSGVASEIAAWHKAVRRVSGNFRVIGADRPLS